MVNPHPPFTSNATWEAYVDQDELEASLTHARAAAKAVADDARQHKLPPLQEEPES